MKLVDKETGIVEYRPLSEALGAEVLGLDMAAPVDAGTAASLREAFARHGLLLVRGQKVTTEQQTRFAQVFGDVVIREKNVVPNQEATAQHVSNTRKDGILATGELDFHMDQLFHQQPLTALILYGIEVPAVGGDTRFCNTTAAYERMPAALRDRIDSLQCRHAYTFAGALAKDWNIDDAEIQPMSAVHPMVWRHPDTRSRAVWVNKMTTVEVLGLPEEEGRALMQEVRRYFYSDGVTYTHKWRVDDLVIWDNRLLQHARTPVDESLPRTLRRSPII